MVDNDTTSLKRRGTDAEQTTDHQDGPETPNADEIRAFAAKVERLERQSSADMVDYELTPHRKEVSHVWFGGGEGPE